MKMEMKLQQMLLHEEPTILGEWDLAGMYKLDTKRKKWNFVPDKKREDPITWDFTPDNKLICTGRNGVVIEMLYQVVWNRLLIIDEVNGPKRHKIACSQFLFIDDDLLINNLIEPDVVIELCR